MHETAKRLLAVGLAKGMKNFAEIARKLDASDQTATNWKSPKRGVSKQGVFKASAYFDVDALWLCADPKGRRPEWLPAGAEDDPVEAVTADPSTCEQYEEITIPPAPEPEDAYPQLRAVERRTVTKPALTDDEHDVLDGYRVASAEDRIRILGLCSIALREHERKGAARTKHG